VGILPFALGLPEASEASRGTEFPGFCLLVAGHGYSLLETGFRLDRIRGGLT
jgi:hypothetical protein